MNTYMNTMFILIFFYTSNGLNYLFLTVSLGPHLSNFYLAGQRSNQVHKDNGYAHETKDNLNNEDSLKNQDNFNNDINLEKEDHHKSKEDLKLQTSSKAKKMKTTLKMNITSKVSKTSKVKMTLQMKHCGNTNGMQWTYLALLYFYEVFSYLETRLMLSLVYGLNLERQC